jgi:dynein heavy chain, axonemal
MNFMLVPEFKLKVLQLFDTFNVRFGVMVVGPSGGGKSTCFRVLQHAMTSLHRQGSQNPQFNEVKVKVLNPKSISMGELYGEENQDTKEWTDGLASKIMRKFADDQKDRLTWTVFDGPVDALWIENMNTVLDDNQTLCLANGERIKLSSKMRILFEVQDLKAASPATVSRCGMVYMTPSELGWRPYVH